MTLLKEKIVPFDFEGRLDRFLRRDFRHLPQSLLEKYIRKGDVKVNHKRVKSSARILGDDVVSYPEVFETFAPIDTGRKKDPHLFKKFEELLVHENYEFCAINKPYNIASQGGSNVKYSIDDMANAGSLPYYLVHRLDKHTSGLLLLAKNSVTANVFMHQFREKKIQKYYVALINMKPEKESGVIDLPLTDDFDTNVKVSFSEGKEARTRYRLVGKVGDYYCMILKPSTGRKHQIRVHLKEGLNAPIVGDERYGGIREKRMYLHAYKIKLPRRDDQKLVIKIPYDVF